MALFPADDAETYSLLGETVNFEWHRMNRLNKAATAYQ